ncbi:BrnA antitoxin family protein [Pseudomonas sp. LRF_L74]|uniref:BrnA antitoxin family protein n=1 Tax=Pseudomonas sp. LRF_L74 TaxID=3369422 RepID=UPI003F63FC85
MNDEYDFSQAKRGAVAPSKGKTRITIMLDDAVLEAARNEADSKGIGYQTLINGLLREALVEDDRFEKLARELKGVQTQLKRLVQMQEAQGKYQVQGP